MDLKKLFILCLAALAVTISIVPAYALLWPTVMDCGYYGGLWGVYGPFGPYAAAYWGCGFW